MSMSNSCNNVENVKSSNNQCCCNLEEVKSEVPQCPCPQEVQSTDNQCRQNLEDERSTVFQCRHIWEDEKPTVPKCRPNNLEKAKPTVPQCTHDNVEKVKSAVPQCPCCPQPQCHDNVEKVKSTVPPCTQRLEKKSTVPSCTHHLETVKSTVPPCPYNNVEKVKSTVPQCPDSLEKVKSTVPQCPCCPQPQNNVQCISAADRQILVILGGTGAADPCVIGAKSGCARENCPCKQESKLHPQVTESQSNANCVKKGKSEDRQNENKQEDNDHDTNANEMNDTQKDENKNAKQDKKDKTEKGKQQQQQQKQQPTHYRVTRHIHSEPEGETRIQTEYYRVPANQQQPFNPLQIRFPTEEESFRTCIVLLTSWTFLFISLFFLLYYGYQLEWSPETADPIHVFSLDLAVNFLYIMFIVDILSSIAIILSYKENVTPFRLRVFCPAISVLIINQIHGTFIWLWVWTGEFPRTCARNTYFAGRKCENLAFLLSISPEGTLSLGDCKCDYGGCLPECGGLRLIQHYFWGTYWLYFIRLTALIILIPRFYEVVCQCKWCCCPNPQNLPTVFPSSTANDNLLQMIIGESHNVNTEDNHPASKGPYSTSSKSPNQNAKSPRACHQNRHVRHDDQQEVEAQDHHDEAEAKPSHPFKCTVKHVDDYQGQCGFGSEAKGKGKGATIISCEHRHHRSKNHDHSPCPACQSHSSTHPAKSTSSVKPTKVILRNPNYIARDSANVIEKCDKGF